MPLAKTVALLAMTVLAVPWLAAADDLEQEIGVLDQRLEQLERQLEAQKEKIANTRPGAGERRSQRDRTDENKTALSALSSFFDKTDFTGSVAAGWSYISDSVGVEKNTFQLDQAWIEMEKVPTEESRAGFDIALEMGAYATQGGNADWQNAPPEDLVIGPGASDTIALFSAYASYLAPLGNGLLIQGGILPSPLGMEEERQSANWQISRGSVWYLQPKTNTGATARYYVTDQLTVMVGALNDPMAGYRRDDDTAKAITSQFRFAKEQFDLRAGVNWGRVNESHTCQLAYAGASQVAVGMDACDSEGIFDLVASLNPTGRLAIWANYDYLWAKGGQIGGEITANALALAGRYRFVDSLGLSLRIEWIKAVEDSSTRTGTYSRHWDITVTLDFIVTKNLTAKVEYRRDNIDSRMVLGVFEDQGWQANSVQTQLLYKF